MYTEVEAKAKQCPLVRYCSNQIAVLQDKDVPIYEHSNCITDGCMAWKWHRQEYESGEPLPFGTVPADPGWEKDGTVRCCGGEYGRGEDRQKWRRPLPLKGTCTAMRSER